ncbi:hypothetical protein [Burkholderia anthina]|uniref:Uncharacterized protein n=1 Tax=Burkholderia anthina TaxID=179879 RepID=A0A7T7AKU7_9BURK|nr:hypothetical protein [Burkholderia anthina]QQK06376.1 hypothetical protein JFN94_21290 [Burkholderia anthina]
MRVTLDKWPIGNSFGVLAQTMATDAPDCRLRHAFFDRRPSPSRADCAADAMKTPFFTAGRCAFQH